MIDANKFKINFIKRENQTGSHLGMRFTFHKADEQLKATIYPEPFCMDATPDDKKESKDFELSQEGLEAAVDWLNEQYNARKAYWESAYENRMNF